MTGKKSSKDYKVIYREIVDTAKNNQEEVGELVIIKHGLSHKTYKNNISSSPVAKALSEKDKEVLKEMLEVVGEYEKKLIEVELPIAENLIDSYISSDSVDAKSYCEANNMDAETFERAKRLVNLYNKEKNAVLNKEQKVKDLIRRKMISEQIEKIAGLITNGIELENGEKRNFDLIDYYECTDIPPKKLYVYISAKRVLFGDLNHYDISEVKKYLFKITSNPFLQNPINIESKLSETIEFNCKKDENGKLLSGTGETVTEAERISLIEYLASKNLPLIEGTYNAGIKRIMNKTFNVNDKTNEETKKLKLEK